ncbi:glycosyltransferase family 4 protein [Geitlerinema sp. PCC 9228]|jgi:glycosyltransferase involved in cell wall biosynthesis|uniref:glycosyltransferase family 4 protein n=1 Tax=Geitlerinema sp. PCC 9228 TaxID=111611 RepID=UPI0008F9AAA9|nr:glycosyltransferase family 4 protein [Geitlerinema sp. PCC 9228]
MQPSRPKRIVHVADIEISPTSGMGRVAWYWRQAFERRGYEFIHLGPQEVKVVPQRSGSIRGLFPYGAYWTYKRLGERADLFLLHEAASAPFLKKKIPTVVFSHGLDRRLWQLNQQRGVRFPWKTRLSYPIWRLRPCDLGGKHADLLALINSEDVEFAQQYYQRDRETIYIFKNGVYASQLTENDAPPEKITVLFLASWIGRKGIHTLVEAAKRLHEKGWEIYWLLAGTGADKETVLDFFPESLHPFIEVIPRFQRDSEADLFARSHIFVLPSAFEGQPLSLLQAMETGRCCITTNCCGQRDIIQHGENGLLHEVGDAETMASLVEQCVRDDSFRKKLGENARLSVQDRSWEAVSAAFVDKIEATFFS